MNNYEKSTASWIDYLKTFPLFLLPTHFLSALLHRFMRIEWKAFKNYQIKLFCKVYPVKLEEAANADCNTYENFNQFFTRALKPDARPIEKNAEQIISPVDGAISELGPIKTDLLFQAKNHYFSIADLLGGDAELAKQFEHGQFATIYLSPKDYHRIHMPVEGTLEQMIHVPGQLFGVNPSSVKAIPNLFARNERVVNLFQTPLGPMALIQVGAIFVSSIETTWHGVVTPPRRKQVQTWSYQNQEAMTQGEEMGRFNMGSTVILLFAKDRMQWQEGLKAGDLVRLGMPIGQTTHSQI